MHDAEIVRGFDRAYAEQIDRELMSMCKMHRFTRPYHQFAVGDRVPDTFTPGIVATLKARGWVEEVPGEAAAAVPAGEEKMIEGPPADKMVRREKVKRK